MLSIVTLNWNAWDQTENCLRRLHALKGNFQVVLVDNGSRESMPETLRTELERDWSLGIPVAGKRRLDLILNSTNAGFPGGCNIGLARALESGATSVLLLNNDAWPETTSFDALEAFADKHPRALVGCVTTEPSGCAGFSGANWPQSLFGNSKFEPPNSDFWVSGYLEGSALLLPRSFCLDAIHERGMVFDESFFLYCEDADLSRFALDLGYRCLMFPGLKIFHVGSQSGGGKGNRYAYYYITRNRIRLANRWLSWPARILFHTYYLPSRAMLALLRGPRLGKRLLHAIYSGLVDGYLGRTGKWSDHQG